MYHVYIYLYGSLVYFWFIFLLHYALRYFFSN